MAPAAARVARTTVYDAFRLGRARINAQFVGEIVRALGADEDTALAWEARARAARNGGPAQTVTLASLPPDAPVEAAVSAREEANPEEPVPAAAPPGRIAQISPVAFSLLLMAACILLDLLGHATIARFGLPFYLDMIGTAVAAFALGPWRGAAVGAASNVVAMLVNPTVALPFAIVDVIGALLWGYGVHGWRMGRTFPRFLALNLIVGVACTAATVGVLFVSFGGDAGATSAILDVLFGTIGVSIPFLSISVLTAIADKVLTGFIALAIVVLLARRRPLTVELFAAAS